MAITLLDMLLDAGMVSRAQCDEALQNRIFFGGRIGTNLIELGFLDEETLALFLSRKLAVPYVDPDRLLNLPAGVIDLIPTDLALKYHVIPLSLENRRLSLAMADPSDLRAIDEIAFITGWIVKPLVCPEIRMIQALGCYYHGEVEERYRQLVGRMEEEREKACPEEAEVAQVIEVTNFDPSLANWREEDPQEVDADTDTESNTNTDTDTGTDAEDHRHWIEQVDRFSIDQVRHALAVADDREEIAEIVVSYLAKEFGRVGLFLIRGEMASGWKARAGKKEVAGFPLLHIPLAPPSVLNAAARDQGHYLGPVPLTFWNSRLLEGLGCERPDSALIMPLNILDRVVGLVYLQDWHLPLPEGLSELQRLLTKTEQAFEILILREKILMG